MIFSAKRAIGFSSLIKTIKTISHYFLVFFWLKASKFHLLLNFGGFSSVQALAAFKAGYWGPFLKSLDSKLCNFMSAVFAFKIKVLIILKMIQ